MYELQIISSDSSDIAFQCIAISDDVFGKYFHKLFFFSSEYKIKLFALLHNKVIGFLIAKNIEKNLIEIESIGIKADFQNQSKP